MRANHIIRIVAALLSALLAISPLAGCGEDTGGVDYGFSYSLTANPKNLDPQMASDNNSLLVIKNIFEGLMRTDSSGSLIQGVAESYTVNDEDTEYTFQLRRDAKWSNGAPVTAYDFEFAWRRAIEPGTGSPTANSLYCIRNAEAVHKGREDSSTLGITVVDTYTLKVVLEYPYAEFPLQTTQPVYMPCNEEFFESTSGHYGLEDDYVICNGPFCFATTAEFLEEDSRSTAWNPDNYVRMIRNQYYVGQNKCLPRILYLGVRHNNPDYYNLLEAETVEAAKIESQNVKKLEKTDFITYSYTDRTWGILFNTQSNGLGNAYVRQGFAMCVDDSMYRDYLADNTEVAYDIVPPVTKLNGMLYRELAGSGMKIKTNIEAAYSTYKKGLEAQEMKKLPTITAICPNDESTVQLMQKIVQSWQDNLLLYVNLEPLDEDTLNNRVQIGDYQIALWCLAPTKDSPVNCLNIFASSNYYNPARLQSPAYDHLIDLSSSKTTTEDVLVPLVAAEKYLNDNAVFFPLYYETSYFATLDTVDGIYFSPFDGAADYCSAVCYD